MKRTLGTCYYPEQWPQDLWETDAKRMAEVGLTWVRIGEFAWSKLEPIQGQYQFAWLDKAIDTLGRHGLKVVLGTPTATPPRWMIDKHPDMLAFDKQGHIRTFGSRRHYCFSHEGYKTECAKIVKLLAERYGKNPYLAAWQTDNEYGCHDTTLSYSKAARAAFRIWLKEHYGDIDALNQAWGNAFWSMDYNHFDQIDLPNLTVTEPNPAHSLAFRQFSSDQVIRFNKLQVDIIRAHSSAPIAHNYMGRITDFDHFDVGKSLDIASWDSYPLGFLEDRIEASDEHKRRFARQGDPDFQAFHHDLYRTVGRGRWWVMEQQPGPVNWTHHNPAPLPGMVYLWSWEAFAHGAEAVCYFRWRQAASGQEQMHAGLLRPDSIDAPTMEEVERLATELASAPNVSICQAPVAILFDYAADFAWTVQPHGQGFAYFDLIFDCYKALRALGLSIDILPTSAGNVSDYAILFAPGLMHMPSTFKETLQNSGAEIVLGPRSAAKDTSMQTAIPLPPNWPGLDVTVSRVESLRPDMPIPLKGGGHIIKYREYLEGSACIVETTKHNEAAIVAQNKIHYVAGWLDQIAWQKLIQKLSDKCGLETIALPEGVRVRDTCKTRFWFNFDTAEHRIEGITLPPISVTRMDKPHD